MHANHGLTINVPLTRVIPMRRPEPLPRWFSPPCVPFKLRFYNQRRVSRSCASSFNDLLNYHSLVFLSNYEMCSPCGSRPRRFALVIRQPVDYRYQLLIHPPISSYIRRETTRTLVSRGLLLLTRTIFPVIPRRFLNIRF